MESATTRKQLHSVQLSQRGETTGQERHRLHSVHSVQFQGPTQALRCLLVRGIGGREGAFEAQNIELSSPDGTE